MTETKPTDIQAAEEYANNFKALHGPVYYAFLAGCAYKEQQMQDEIERLKAEIGNLKTREQFVAREAFYCGREPEDRLKAVSSGQWPPMRYDTFSHYWSAINKAT